MKLALLIAIVAASLSGCACGAEPRATRAPPDSRWTSALPKWAVEACATIPDLARFCPQRGPLARGDTWLMETFAAHAGEGASYLWLERGAQFGGVTPPQGASLLAASAPADGALRTFRLAPAVRRPLASWDGTIPAKAIDGGRRRWGGLTGRVFLTRSEHALFGRRLAFTWLDGSRRRMVAVGAWAPVGQALDALRTIVRDLHAQRATEAPEPAEPIDDIAMVATPAWLATLCREQLESGCPATVPRPSNSFSLTQITPLRHGRRYMDIDWGGGTGNARLDRPPRLVHLILSDGERRARARVLRRCFGNHVCYRWRSGGQNHLISIHAWRPLPHTLRVFRAVVRSIQGA